jgi:hypothetical protein
MGFVVNTTSRPLYAREKPGTHCIAGWVRPMGRSGLVRKISLSPEFDPRTVQPGSESLYRQSYPSPNFLWKPLQFINITYYRFYTRLVLLLCVSVRPTPDITRKTKKVEYFILLQKYCRKSGYILQSITAH